MAERPTAESQLARVLDLLPRAARAGGVSLAELAAELGVDERDVLRDLQEVYTRAYYHPAGGGEGVQVLIESDQVAVWTSGEFRRPPRLNPREALALGLGLRILAAESPPAARDAMLALAGRMERGLSSEVPEALLAGIAVSAGDDSPAGVRGLLRQATRERRRCEIAYLKPGAPEPERRLVDPYVLLAADGRWYLVGHCRRNSDVRVFRADRVVEAVMLPETFVVPDGFDPRAYVSDGRVFRSAEGVEVAVRFSARIARWIEEQGPAEAMEDGSVVVRYRVADPEWLVRHVLQHGPDAEVLGPPEMRERVREAVRRLSSSPGGRAPVPPDPVLDPPGPPA